MQCCVRADNEKEVVHQLQQGLETQKSVSFWLYSMLAQPYSTDQLLLKGKVPTQLSAVVNSSTYDLGFNTSSGMRGAEVRPLQPTRGSVFRSCPYVSQMSCSSDDERVSHLPVGVLQHICCRRISPNRIAQPRVWEHSHRGCSAPADHGQWRAEQSRQNNQFLPSVLLLGAHPGCCPLARGVPFPECNPRPHSRRHIPQWPAAQLPHCQNTVVSSLIPPVPWPSKVFQSLFESRFGGLHTCQYRTRVPK